MEFPTGERNPWNSGDAILPPDDTSNRQLSELVYPQMPALPLQSLQNQFSQFNRADVLAQIGGLLLMPENAARVARLELAACAAAGLPSNSATRRIPVNALRKIINGKELSNPYLLMQEDPVGGWFVESLTFTGGAYLVLPGITSHATFIVRQLCRAIAFSSRAFHNPRFSADATALLASTLSLSDSVVRRAGLDRGISPIERPKATSIMVPSAKRLRQLSEAVKFTRSELETVLQHSNSEVSALDAMVAKAGELHINECDIHSHPLQARPIVEIEGDYVVAAPSLLLAALRHAVVRLAKHAAVLPELATEVNEAAWSTTVEALRRLDIREHASWNRDRPNILMAEGLFEIDSDKAMYACMLGDDLADYDEDVVFGNVPSSDLWSVLKRHFETVFESLARSQHPPNELLCLLLTNPSGRARVFGVGEHGENRPYELLTISAPELETISFIEDPDSLLLWKFARARRRLRDVTKVFAFGTINEFGFYRDRNYSLYVTDDRPASALSFNCDWEGMLYKESLEKVDPHGVLSYDREHIADVVALHGTRDVPIYVTQRSLKHRIALLIEGYSIPIWIVGPPPIEKEDARNHSIIGMLANTIAYWLWQFTPSLSDWVDEAFEGTRDVFVISIVADGPLELLANELQQVSERKPYDVCPGTGGVDINITVYPAINALLYGPDNKGEKQLMKAVISGIRELASPVAQDRLSDSRIDVIVDQHASDSLKKMMIVMDSHREPMLDKRGLPHSRLIATADENELLDELGEFLRTEKRNSTGPIPSDQRTGILNSAVEYYYNELASLVSSLNPEGLLEMLVVHHEAILRETAFQKLVLPTRLACFETHERLCEHWRTLSSDLAKAALSIRFLIEFVAARPPRGLRPMSYSVLDRLLALASETIQVGFQSDLIHYGLIDPDMSILRSGRLGRDFDSYEAASKTFMGTRSARDISSLSEEFARRWSSDSILPLVETAQMDVSTCAEFGYSLTQIGTLWAAARVIARDSSPGVLQISRNSLVERLAQSISWEEHDVENLLDKFSLTARTDFLSPPPPYHKHDVWPWRFTRAYSYIRCPFLVVQGPKETEVVLGPRHLHQAWRYLLHLCFDGRLQASSPKMKAMVGRLKEEAGRAFNDSVADALHEVQSMVVRRRLKKIRGRRIPPVPFGDIDVLVVDQTHRSFLAIECKDLALARTPREMAQDLELLFSGRKQRPSTVEKQLKRAEWVRSHVGEILDWLCLDRAGEWTVEPLIVLDHRPLSAYLIDSPIPVLSVAELLDRFSH